MLCFDQIVLCDPKNGSIELSGITQLSANVDFETIPVPRDPSKAAIGNTNANNIRRGDKRFSKPFVMVDMEYPDRNRGRSKLFGYPIHTRCWLLLDRVIGQREVQSDLRIFVGAIEQFWKRKEHLKIWGKDDEYTDDVSDRFSHPYLAISRKNLRIHQTVSDPWEIYDEEAYDSFKIILQCFRHNDYVQKAGELVNTYKDLWIIPEIQMLIQQAIQDENKSAHIVSRCGQTGRSFVLLPFDIVLIIVEVLYDEIRNEKANIQDTKNLLFAFQWRLPDTYWQRRCDTELIFELGELVRQKRPANWQHICLGIEELLLQEG